MTSYVKRSLIEANSKRREYSLYGRIMVLVKDPLPEDIHLADALRSIEERVPERMFHNVDIVYIGEFPELEERDVASAYLDGAIYTTNTHHTSDDFIKNIIHEMAHSIEQYSKAELYYDGKIENEFLGKRKRLASQLSQNDLAVGFDISKLMNPEYDKEVDEFLWFSVGYPTLVTLTMGLFATPYSAACLREYFAEGVEQYFIGAKEDVAQISPALYNKIKQIDEFLI
jgi:hypothetical protein